VKDHISIKSNFLKSKSNLRSALRSFIWKILSLRLEQVAEGKGINSHLLWSLDANSFIQKKSPKIRSAGVHEVPSSGTA